MHTYLIIAAWLCAAGFTYNGGKQSWQLAIGCVLAMPILFPWELGKIIKAQVMR